MPSRKKQDERWFLERLRSQVTDLPDGEIVEHEQPDFLIRSRQETLGIELTRLFKKHPDARRVPQADESERRRVVDTARRLFERTSKIPLEVSVFFSGSASLTKADRERLSRQITDLVVTNIPESNAWCRIDFESCGFSFPNEIASILIARFDVLTQGLWTVPAFGWVQEDFIEGLQGAIQAKMPHLGEYLRKCDRCWLLIVADASGASTFFSASQTTLGHQYQSTFERTYFVQTLSGDVFRLNTTANGA
jgi:hypothetical protein